MTDTISVTERLLREIQRELADMRDDRTVMMSMLERHDTTMTGISTELRALRSQFDRFRIEVRADIREMREDLHAIRTLLER